MKSFSLHEIFKLFQQEWFYIILVEIRKKLVLTFVLIFHHGAIITAIVIIIMQCPTRLSVDSYLPGISF